MRRTGESALLGKAASERAMREARALAGLRHASIQKLHDVVEGKNGPMLVLEPVPGEALAARLARQIYFWDKTGVACDLCHQTSPGRSPG